MWPIEQRDYTWVTPHIYCFKLLTENYSAGTLKRPTLHHLGYHQETKSEAKVHSLMKVKVGIQSELQNLLEYLIQFKHFQTTLLAIPMLRHQWFYRFSFQSLSWDKQKRTKFILCNLLKDKLMRVLMDTLQDWCPYNSDNRCQTLQRQFTNRARTRHV